jgi:hypothetical protein
MILKASCIWLARLVCAGWILAFAGAVSAQTSQQRYLEALVDFQRHGETVWRAASGASRPPDSGYWGDGVSAGNAGIRGSCGVAVAYAVLVKAQPGDTDNPARLAKIRQALNYAANAHQTGSYTCVDGKKWGRVWQSSLWAASMGLACILVEDQLPAQTVADVRRVVADEATFRGAVPPQSGYVSDTKAEENAWDSNILALSAAWMKTNANAASWLLSAKKYLANTYTVPSKAGDPLAAWLTTTTLYPSFALENHGFYHPTYQMVAGMSLGDSLLMARLGDTAVADELRPFAEHNVMAVWTNNLQAMVVESGEFAYPSGLDWALHDYEHNSYIAWLATHFDDPLARYADAQLAHMVRHRQQVNGDGRFVGESESNGFYREAVEARRTAIAWLHHEFAAHPAGPATPPPDGVTHFTDVKIISQRSAAGFVSLSYGPKIMMIVEPKAASVPTNAFTTTPRLPGILGLGALGNPTAASLVSFSTNAEGFDAELLLTHGANGTTRAYVKSTGESVGLVEVPLPAVGVSGTSAGSFSVGIENHALTGGSRLIEWTGGSATVTERSGATRFITNGWLNVSGRYGLKAGPGGYFRYDAASGYNRLGAAQDTLSLFPQEPLAARYAVWFPGKSTAETAAASAATEWTVTGTNAVLRFPGPGGALREIRAVVPRATRLPYAVVPGNVTASSSQSGYPPGRAIDGDTATFWVSGGTTAGQEPTPAAPEWLKFGFARKVAVSGFQITPRVNYGPKGFQLELDGAVVHSGTMSNGALSVTLPTAVTATNALLRITGTYDGDFPPNSGNVQIIEVSFWERAQPGTFLGWQLSAFTDAELDDDAVSGALADPDHDEAGNLLEFVMGGAPKSPDPAEVFQLHPARSDGDILVFRFRQRRDLAGIVREFQTSRDLAAWSPVAPTRVVETGRAGEVDLLEATVPVGMLPSFFRVQFRQAQ